MTIRSYGLFLLCLVPVLLNAQSRQRIQVEISTEAGTIVVELYDETPLHRDNFLALVKAGAYDSTIFHRVIPGFMIQGGRPVGEGDTLADPLKGSVQAEIVPGLFHKRGALAAARQGDDIDPQRRSDRSEFYIVQGKTYKPEDLDRVEERNRRFGEEHEFTEAEREVYATRGGAPHLDGAYTVFGHVVQGMEVVDAIAAQPVDAFDRPLRDIHMFMRVR